MSFATKLVNPKGIMLSKSDRTRQILYGLTIVQSENARLRETGQIGGCQTLLKLKFK